MPHKQANSTKPLLTKGNRILPRARSKDGKEKKEKKDQKRHRQPEIKHKNSNAQLFSQISELQHMFKKTA